VVQEAFCGLFRAWDRLPADTNVLGYLRVSVVNGCRTMIRRSKRTPRAAPRPLAGFSCSGHRLVSPPPVTCSSPQTARN